MEWLPLKALIEEYGLAVLGFLMFGVYAWRVYKDQKADKEAERSAYTVLLNAYNAALVDTTRAMTHQTVLFDERTRSFEDLAEALRSLSGNIRELANEVKSWSHSRGRAR